MSWGNQVTGEKAHIDGLVQERRNSSALAMELRLFRTNPSIFYGGRALTVDVSVDNIGVSIDPANIHHITVPITYGSRKEIFSSRAPVSAHETW